MGTPFEKTQSESKLGPQTEKSHEATEKATMGAGYATHEAAERKSYMQPAHQFGRPPSKADGFGHPKSLMKGSLRMSGHSGAHCIGQKKK